MRIVSVVLLVSGWFIVMAALVLLVSPSERFSFIVAGLLVQSLGLGLLARSFIPQRTARLRDGFGRSQ